MEKIEYRNVHSNQDVQGFKERIRNSSMSQRQKDLIEKFILDLRIGKAGSKVKDRRLGSYLQFMIYLHDIFNKDLDKITEQEATTFYTNLQDNKIRRQNGMPYSTATKDLFVRTLKRYLGWSLHGRDNKEYKKIVGWMKEDYKKSDKKAILFEDVLKIIEKEKYIRNKALIMFLFDSGARIEECLNVRIQDITKGQKKKKQGEYYMVHLRGQKTEESDRTVSIPLTTKYLNDWLQEHPTKEPKDFVFPINYDNARKIVRESSTKALGFALKPHEMRHSSATYYVQKFGAENISGFYYRFGWKFGSDEAKTYIKQYLFAGEVGQEKVVNIVEADKVEKLEAELSDMKAKMAFIDELRQALLQAKQGNHDGILKMLNETKPKKS